MNCHSVDDRLLAHMYFSMLRLCVAKTNGQMNVLAISAVIKCVAVVLRIHCQLHCMYYDQSQSLCSMDWHQTPTILYFQHFQHVTTAMFVVQRGLAPRVFEYIFKRIAEEEDNAVSLNACWLSDVI